MRARAERNGYKNGTKYNGLASQVVYGMLPTPTMFDYNTPRSPEAWQRAKEKHGDALQVPLKQLAANGMLPTPAARDYKGANSLEHLRGENGNKMKHDGQLPNFIKLGTGSTSQLNPRFVAEMMGFPVNWTELPFQNGEKSQ
jgi:hypothetical protein